VFLQANALVRLTAHITNLTQR